MLYQLLPIPLALSFVAFAFCFLVLFFLIRVFVAPLLRNLGTRIKTRKVGHPGKQPSFSVSQDLENSLFYVRMKRYRGWEAVLHKDGEYFTDRNRGGHVLYFPDHEMANSFAETQAQHWRNLHHDWRSLRGRIKSVHSTVIHK